MNTVKIKLSELVEFPNNVRIHTKRNLDTIKNSLKEFGQVKPILVQKSTNYIIAGNGTYQAAKALGWQEMDCNVLDLDDEKARALSIVDNRSGDLSQMDEKNLLDFLKDFDKQTLDLTGYDDKELDKMLSFQEGTLFEEQKKPKEKKKKKEQPISSDDQISFILLGHPFVLADPDEIKEFKRLIDKLDNEDLEVKCEVTFQVFDAIKEVLKQSLGETNTDNSIQIEDDRG